MLICKSPRARVELARVLCPARRRGPMKFLALAQCLVVARSLTTRPIIPSGFAVVARSVLPAASPAAPLVQHLLMLWPERFATKSAAKKACRRKLVLVDGEVGRTAHVASAAVEISVLARVKAGPAPGSGRRALARPEEQLAVLFEDDHLAVVVKPAGVDVPALRTLLAASLAPSQAAEHEPLWRPQHVHRLDKPTRGLLVAAKTGQALRALSAAFAARQVRKRYRAVVAGELGTLEAPPQSVRVPLSGQEAWTEWVAVARLRHSACGAATLVDLYPHTGRTHQLRRHMALLGHPIVGDARYWPRSGPLADALADSLADPPAVAAEGGESRAESGAKGEAGGGTEGGGVESGTAAGIGPPPLHLAAVEIDLAHPLTGEPLSVFAEEPEEWRRSL